MVTFTPKEFCDSWLTPDEHGRTALSYMEENLAEHEAQYLSECAMFGDAGPGQGLQLQQMKAEHAKVVSRLKQFGVI